MKHILKTKLYPAILLLAFNYNSLLSFFLEIITVPRFMLA
jgi:hypothetical protein